MKTVTQRWTAGLVLAALVLAGQVLSSPAWAVSARVTGHAQPRPLGPEQREDVPSGPVAMEPVAMEPVAMESEPSRNLHPDTWAAGSAALIPVVATDLPATTDSALEASAPAGGAVKARIIDDFTFVARATQNARLEAQAARHALRQLQDPELRRIAAAMARDRVDVDLTLTRLAAARRWPIPAALPADTPPAGTANPDFDARWTTEMISAHERSLALYSIQARSGEDKDLREYARDTLPTLRHHLAELRRVQK